MDFFEAINPGKGDIIALVGGGGKTSIMFRLGQEAAKRGLKTVLTTTTKIFYPIEYHKQVILSTEPDQLYAVVRDKLSEFQLIVAATQVIPGNKLLGVNKLWISGFLKSGADLVIVEADGAAQKPLKAPADHEPVIPPETTILMPVVGLDCLGKPLNHFHRPEIMAQIAKVASDDIVEPRTVAVIATHPQGLRKHMPANSRFIPFINKVDYPGDIEPALEIAAEIQQRFPCNVLLGAARHGYPVKRFVTFHDFP